MRFRLLLQLCSEISGNAIPKSYGYDISEWIYGVFNRNEQTTSHWMTVNKIDRGPLDFQHFCYALQLEKVRVETFKLFLESPYAELYLSFWPETGTEELVRTLFDDQHIVVGNPVIRAVFAITQIDLLETPILEHVIFKTLSPIRLLLHRSDETAISMSPDTGNYGELLFQNLIKKYQLLYGIPFSGVTSFQFQLASPPVMQTIILKPETKNEQKLRAFHVSFRMDADPVLLKIGYETGFGIDNSFGFGLVKAESQM